MTSALQESPTIPQNLLPREPVAGGVDPAQRGGVEDLRTPRSTTLDPRLASTLTRAAAESRGLTGEAQRATAHLNRLLSALDAPTASAERGSLEGAYLERVNRSIDRFANKAASAPLDPQEVAEAAQLIRRLPEWTASMRARIDEHATTRLTQEHEARALSDRIDATRGGFLGGIMQFRERARLSSQYFAMLERAEATEKQAATDQRQIFDAEQGVRRLEQLLFSGIRECARDTAMTVGRVSVHAAGVLANSEIALECVRERLSNEFGSRLADLNHLLSPQHQHEFVALLAQEVIFSRSTVVPPALQYLADTEQVRDARLTELTRAAPSELAALRSFAEELVAGPQWYNRMIGVVVDHKLTRALDALTATVTSSSEWPSLRATLDYEVREAARVLRDERGGASQPFGLGVELTAQQLRHFPVADWKALSAILESSAILSRRDLDLAEGKVIKRIHEDVLVPGGGDSWTGPAAVATMAAFENPIAIPYLYAHARTFGIGHTSTAAVRAIDTLVAKLPGSQVDEALSHLSSAERRALAILTDPASVLNQLRQTSRYFDDRIVCSFVQDRDRLLVIEEVAKILHTHDEFRPGADDNNLVGIYIGAPLAPTKRAEEILLEKLPEVEAAIIGSKATSWSRGQPELMKALARDEGGRAHRFAERIAREGLGLSSDAVTRLLDDFYTSKRVGGSQQARETVLEGLLVLHSRPEGAAVLSALAFANGGTREDPTRFKRILDILITLDSLGSFKLVQPSAASIDTARQEKIRIEEDLANPVGQSRKELLSRQRAVDLQLKELTGLKGIEQATAGYLVEVGCEKLQLGPDYRRKLAENLDSLVKTKIFDIVPTLSSQYSSRGQTRQGALLSAATAEFIAGRFTDWRYSPANMAQQLGHLDTAEQKRWRDNLAPAAEEARAEVTSEEVRAGQRRGVDQIIIEVRQHLAEAGVEIPRDAGGIARLAEDLTLRPAQRSDDSRPNRLQLAQLLHDLESITTDTLDPAVVARTTASALEEIRKLNVPQAILDLQQIPKIFVARAFEKLTATESDGFVELLSSGVVPRETCQSWRRGGYNDCLMAYVADANKKLFNVVSERGEVLLRSFVASRTQDRVTEGGVTHGERALFVETAYVLNWNEQVIRAFARQVFAKALHVAPDGSMAVTLGANFDEASTRIFHEEAARAGYVGSTDTLSIHVAESPNGHEYSDSLGGRIGLIQRSYPLAGATVFRKQS